MNLNEYIAQANRNGVEWRKGTGAEFHFAVKDLPGHMLKISAQLGSSSPKEALCTLHENGEQSLWSGTLVRGDGYVLVEYSDRSSLLEGRVPFSMIADAEFTLVDERGRRFELEPTFDPALIPAPVKHVPGKSGPHYL